MGNAVARLGFILAGSIGQPREEEVSRLLVQLFDLSEEVAGLEERLGVAIGHAARPARAACRKPRAFELRWYWRALRRLTGG